MVIQSAKYEAQHWQHVFSGSCFVLDWLAQSPTLRLIEFGPGLPPGPFEMRYPRSSR